MEEFKDIKGYENLYQISNMGRVLSLPRKNTKGGFLKLTILNIKRNRHYYHVVLCKDGITKDFQVHYLVAQAFCFQPSPLHIQVDHIACKGIPEDGLDNRAENLRWVTSQQNSRNRVKPTKGYSLISDGRYKVDLTNPKIKEIQYFGCFFIEEDAIAKVAKIQTQWKLQFPECY
jgi:hypothetical protein